MSAFGRGGDLFSSFMMPPMHQAPPPPPPFGSFNHPFMMGGFGDTGGFFGHDFMPPLMGSSSFQQQQQSFIGSSQNSSRGLSNGGGGGYSKSVSTTTRSVNGVVESVKITTITDSNVSVQVCPASVNADASCMYVGHTGHWRVWEWADKDQWRGAANTASDWAHSEFTQPSQSVGRKGPSCQRQRGRGGWAGSVRRAPRLLLSPGANSPATTQATARAAETLGRAKTTRWIHASAKRENAPAAYDAPSAANDAAHALAVPLSTAPTTATTAI